jgi:hypothetical protein
MPVKKFSRRLHLLFSASAYFIYLSFGALGFYILDKELKEIGRLILSKKWEEAVKQILAPRDDANGKIFHNLRGKY